MKNLRNLALAMLAFGALNLSAQAPAVDYVYDVNPEPGSTFAGFEEGSSIKFKIAPEAPPVFTMRLYNGDGEFWSEWYSHENQFSLEDGYYVHEFLIPYVFIEGETYDIVFSFYENSNITEDNVIATQQISYHGSSTATKSNVTLVSVEPASPGEITLDADGSATVNMTFSAPVKIGSVSVPVGMGVSLPGKASPANDSETQWTLNIPADYVLETVAAYERLLISVYVQDTAGRNIYEDGLPYISLEYTPDLQIQKGSDFDVDIAGKTLEAPVDSFVVSSGQEDVPISPNDVSLVIEENGQYVVFNPYTSITVTSADGTVVSSAETVYYTDEDGEHMRPFKNTVILTTPVTAPGTYAIHFPYQAFHVGEETLATYSMEKTVEFTIAGAQENLMEEATVLNPESATVGSLMMVQLTWDKQTIILDKNANVTVDIQDAGVYRCDLALTTYNEDQDPGISSNEDPENNLLNIYMPFEAFGKVGAFVVNIPQGTVRTADDLVNPAQELTFHVLPLTEIEMTATPECRNFEKVSVEELKTVIISWSEEPIAVNNADGMRLNYKSEQYYIYKDGLVSLGEGNKEIVIDVENLIGEKGEYELVIPEGAFLIGEDDNLTLNQETVLSYIVTFTSGISEVIESQDGKYMVYGLNGVLLLDTDNEALLSSLAPGLYIINGRKVIVK